MKMCHLYLFESPGDSKKVVISLEEHERITCMCLLRCDKTLDDVIFEVQLNVSSYIDVTIYLPLTVGCIVFHSHVVVSRIVDMIMTIRILLITA